MFTDEQQIEQQIKMMIDSLKSIAVLHKKDLESTEAFENWNTCLLFLSRFYVQKNPKDLLAFIEGAFAELKSELPQMISSDKLSEAEGYYLKIEGILHQIEETLNQQESQPERRMSL